jgi:hypothetical protein
MSRRGSTEKTRNDYVRNGRAFARFIGRCPTPRRHQIQSRDGH